MRMTQERATLTVLKREGGWAVDLDGQVFGESIDKEVSKAAANRRAREMQDSGRPCQVRVAGENGFHL